MTIPPPIIELRSITLTFDNAKTLFENLSFSFLKGEFYLVKGPSGVGKSSLLRLLCRLEEPAKGHLLFNGEPFKDIKPPFLRKKIIYIQQTPLALEGSIKENLLFPFSYKINKDNPMPNDNILISQMEAFMLDGISLDEEAKNLSVGQLQRLCLIRGFLLNPDVLLLDEPTSALDRESAKTVENKAERFCRDMGKTVIMISHRDFQPNALSPRIIHIEKKGIKEHS